jgi:two-component system OmpR family sensor kinase
MPELVHRAWAAVSLRTRLLLLLLAGLLSVQVASLWWVLSERAVNARRAALVQQVQRSADLAAVIDAVPRTYRAAVVAAVSYPLVRLDAVPGPNAAPQEVLAVVREAWERRLPGQAVSVVALRVPLPGGSGSSRAPGLRISMTTNLRDGQWLRTEVEVRPPRFRTDGLLGPFLLLGMVTSLLVIVATSWALRPLEQLASGAKALGSGLDVAPLPQRGPPEVRHAAEVLNDLHQRLRQHVQGRVQALAAISHDLRTPITRLRLRAELLADPASRSSFTNDLRQLEDMVQGTLDYLRGIGEAPPLGPVDLDGLLAQAVEDMDVLGVAIECPEPSGAIVRGHAPSLRRALANLLRNAAIHAREPELMVQAEAGRVRIHVMDRGPGIPESEMARVVQPFEQLDRSRGGAGGAGLGLSIANEVAARHAGRLLLSNRVGGGLCVTLDLAAA